MNFNELSLIPPLLRAVADAGYTQPSPIQEKAIPPVLAGRDLLGCAQTGTGKTAAFALPILQLLTAHKAHKADGKKKIRTLILTPTRELALQINENFTIYSKYLPLSSTVIFGGVSQVPQVQTLKRGVDVLVATPGRLNDLIGQGHIKLDAIEIFVLDEADRMLDMGFVQDVKKIIRQLPEKRQTLLFSATMPDEIVKLADSLLQKPAKVFVTPVSSTVDMIDQTIYKVDKTNKRFLLAKLLHQPDVTSALVFTRTKHGADRVVRELTKEKIQAMAIHGNKSQNARQDALKRFKEGKIKVLVATDIAARGIDISELSHVFNYDLPNIPETYVHRIGRTGRAGRGGIAIGFCSFDELPFLADIERLIGFKITEITGHDWPMQQNTPSEKKPQNGNQRRASAPKPLAGNRENTPVQKQPAAKTAQPQRKNTKNNVAPKKPAQPIKTEPAKVAVPPPAATPKQPLRLSRVETEAAKTQQQNSATPNNKPAKPRPAGQNRNNRRPAPYDPYDGLTGGKAIVTKRPIWGGEAAMAEDDIKKKEGEPPMSRNNKRRSNKSRPPQAQPVEEKKAKPPEIPKNENGVFDFSEEELAEDAALKVVSRGNGEAKYANFEDFLKNH